MTEDEMRAAVAPFVDLLQVAEPGDAIMAIRASPNGACNFSILAPDVGVLAAFAKVLLAQIMEAVTATPPDKRTLPAIEVAAQASLASAALSNASCERITDQDDALLLASPAGHA